MVPAYIGDARQPFLRHAYPFAQQICTHTLTCLYLGTLFLVWVKSEVGVDINIYVRLAGKVTSRTGGARGNPVHCAR